MNSLSFLFIALFLFIILPLQTKSKNFHLILNSHLDLTWALPFDQYYYGSGKGYYSYACVRCIFDNLIEILDKNPSRKFTISEMYYIQKYYYETLANDQIKRQKFVDLVRKKQIIIAQPGLCIYDQSTNHYDDIIDQMTLGNFMAFEIFGEKIETGWSIDAFGSSYTNSFILQLFGVKNLLIDRISESERNKRIVDSYFALYL